MLARNTLLRTLLPMMVGFFLLLVTAASAILLATLQRTEGMAVRALLEIESRLNRIETLAVNAETGQRGFLLTGRIDYLDSYDVARREIGPEFDALAQQTADSDVQQQFIAKLRPLFSEKLDELRQTVDLRVAGRTDDALAVVNDDRGKNLMSGIRSIIAQMRAEGREQLNIRGLRGTAFNRTAQAALVVSLILVVVIAVVVLRDARNRILALQTANAQLQREVGERRAAQSQVRQLQKMEAVGQLTGGIAHDFNNMLAIVIGSLNLGKRRLKSGDLAAVEKSVDNAVEGAQRAAALTSRLLAFSRQQPLEPKTLDANKLVGGMSELLQRTIGEHVRIETVLSAGLWRVFADPAQVETAVLNLAVNARDAMPEGGKLTIETANSDLDERYARDHDEVTPGQYVMISVTDTGTGMAPDVIERAFDPFYTTKSVGKGTGLGLSQVFGFVKQSGGHVKIYSEVGQGTTVKIYFPRHTGVEAAVEAVQKLDHAPRGFADEIVLVVEDDRQVRHISIDALRELGYTVLQASTPADALAQIDLQPNIALLFTDIVMPGMNGRQLADKALELLPKMKVLYTTGYTRNAVVHNGMLDPGTAFLPKPFTFEQLAMKVRDVLGPRSS